MMAAASSRETGEIESELRRVVADRRYAAVESLARAFCAAAAAEAAALPARDPDVSRIVCHVVEVLDWARLMLSTARADCAVELKRVAMLNRYLARERTTAAGIRVDG
jgi:hypothetical protein